MGLLEEAREAQSAKRKTGCALSKTLAQMSEEEAAELQAVLDDKTIDAPVISELLARHEYHVGSHTIQVHRRGGCCRG